MEDKPKEILELERALGIDHVDDYVFEGNHLISLSIIQQNLIDITPLSKFQNLVKLILNANQISDLSPLNGLSRLNFLDLHSNEIIDISPLSNLKSIIYLNLELNQIKDISLSFLAASSIAKNIYIAMLYSMNYIQKIYNDIFFYFFAI